MGGGLFCFSGGCFWWGCAVVVWLENQATFFHTHRRENKGATGFVLSARRCDVVMKIEKRLVGVGLISGGGAV